MSSSGRQPSACYEVGLGGNPSFAGSRRTERPLGGLAPLALHDGIDVTFSNPLAFLRKTPLVQVPKFPCIRTMQAPAIVLDSLVREPRPSHESSHRGGRNKITLLLLCHEARCCRSRT